MVRRKFAGKIIYATPGSGKTYLADSYYNVIDGDQVILDIMAEISPSFEFIDRSHPSINILRYFKYAPFNARRLYSEVEDKFLELAGDGDTVLTGTLRLMHLADYVFIQHNERINSSRNFDQRKETNMLNEVIDDGYIEWNQVKYMNNYLEQYIID